MGSTAYLLRPVVPEDAPEVLDAFTSAPDMGRQGPVVDEDTAAGYVAWLRHEDRRAFAIAHRGQLVGLVALTLDTENRSGWVFYWMHAEHRGRGITATAVATVADHALRDLGLERLELGHRVTNPASGGIARAAGFIHEGRERGKFLIDGERIDVLTYGRLPTDPWPDGTTLSLEPHG